MSSFNPKMYASCGPVQQNEPVMRGNSLFYNACTGQNNSYSRTRPPMHGAVVRSSCPPFRGDYYTPPVHGRGRQDREVQQKHHSSPGARHSRAQRASLGLRRPGPHCGRLSRPSRTLPNRTRRCMTSQRARCRQNLLVAAFNTAIERGLITLECGPVTNRTFGFTLASRLSLTYRMRALMMCS